MTQPVGNSSQRIYTDDQKENPEQKTSLTSLPFDPFDHMCKFLPPKELCSLACTSKQFKVFTLAQRLQIIIQDIQHFQGILPIEPFDIAKSNDLNYLENYISRVKDQINAEHELREIFTNCKENFAATAQEIKDRDLIRFFEETAPDFLLQQENVSNHEKAQAIRARLESLPENDPFFQRQVLVLSLLHLTSIPPEIGMFVHLRRLDISENQIQVIPPEIGMFVQLQLLDLSSNQINIIPPEIGSLGQLQVLDLSYNKITVIPPEIGNLVQLHWLFLEYNKIQAIPPEIDSLGQLRELYL